MTKTLLIAGAGLLVVYLLVSRGGGSIFQLAPGGTRLTPTPNPPPYSAGPNTGRAQDANIWSAITGLGTAAINAYGASSRTSGATTTTTPPKYTGDLLGSDWV